MLTDTEKLIKKLSRLMGIIKIYYNKGKHDKSLEYTKKVELIINSFPEKLPIEIIQSFCEVLQFESTIYSYMGDLTHSLESTNKILKIAEGFNDKYCHFLAIQAFGRYFWHTGDLSQALDYFDRAIDLGIDFFNDQVKSYWILNTVMIGIRAAIAKGDLEHARKVFKKIELDHEQETDHFFLKLQPHRMLYNNAKALILKSSTRFRDRALAEEMLMELINEITTSHNTLMVLVDLCELLLNELRLTNDSSIIEEIKPLINKIIDQAKKLNFYYYLIEANILQGKLFLVTFEIREAKRYLIKAQKIAESHGYAYKAIEISKIYEELIQKSELWDQLKENNAPISKRMELANLSGDLTDMIRSSIKTTTQVSEEDISVYKERKTCLVCMGEIEGFNNYICPKCNSIYCESCAKALIEIENICWSCESPIDKSKPMKSSDDEKELNIVNTSDKKND